MTLVAKITKTTVPRTSLKSESNLGFTFRKTHASCINVNSLHEVGIKVLVKLSQKRI